VVCFVLLSLGGIRSNTKHASTFYRDTISLAAEQILTAELLLVRVLLLVGCDCSAGVATVAGRTLTRASAVSLPRMAKAAGYAGWSASDALGCGQLGLASIRVLWSGIRVACRCSTQQESPLARGVESARTATRRLSMQHKRPQPRGSEAARTGEHPSAFISIRQRTRWEVRREEEEEREEGGEREERAKEEAAVARATRVPGQEPRSPKRWV
jgi:hypothetical protein